MAAGIPRVVWTLWLQGWEAAPPLVQACLASWQRRNPTWTVQPLTSETIGDYVDLEAVYPGVNTNDVSAATLSDMVRIALLSEHGGVWADSTVFCVTPLDEWIDDYAATGFFAFARPGPDRMLSSWFLASEPAQPLVLEWRERVREYWHDRRAPDHYFWLHRLFSDAYRTDHAFRKTWDDTRELRSDGPHYFVPYRSRLERRMTKRARVRVLSGVDPVYKLSHRTESATPHPESAYAFFCRGADVRTSSGRQADIELDRRLLTVDRSLERLRWTGRRAGLGLRAAAADRLRALGLRGAAS